MVGAPAGESRVIAERYTVESAIGQGGMGRVWRARDLLLDREVALKELLLPSNMSASVRKEMSDRLLKEARLGARLRHPAIVRVYDVLTVDGNPWMVMELITGQSLDDMVLDGGPLPPTRVAEIGVALLGALGAAHRAGVLHRDVKPANVIIDNDSSVSLTDFGIAFELDKTSLTATGLMIGSPPFIAPERVRGETVGPPSDLFSLGATLYNAVEGRPPFDREGPLPTLAAILNESPDPFQLAGPLQPVLAGLLAKDQHNRMSADAAIEALELISRSAPVVLPATDPMLAVPSPTWPGRPISAQPGPGSVPPPAPEQEASTVQVHQTQILPMGGSSGRASVRNPSPTSHDSVAPPTPHATGRASISRPPAPPIRPVPPTPSRTLVPPPPSRPHSPVRGYAGPQPVQAPPYRPPPAPRRRRTALVIGGIVLALLLAAGAGVVVVLSQHLTNAPTATGSSSGQPGTNPSGTPDAELKPATQITGYSVPIPADWQQISTESELLHGYRPADLPAGTKVRIAFSSPGSANGKSAVKVFQDGSNARSNASAGSQYYVAGFHVIGINKVSFAGREDGAAWEYTWQDGSVMRHNLIYGAIGDNGRSYQLSFQASIDDYPKYQALFANVVAGAKVTV